MSTFPTTIEIPRLDGESARAYAARVAYITMGPQRSIDKVAVQQQRGNGAARSRILMEWSRRYDWVDHARKYDEQIAFLAIQEAATQYRNDLEEHRRRYQQSGKELHAIAVEMLARLRERSNALDYTPATLTTISRALQIAADLEAHALRVGDLLPRLSDDLHSSE